MQAVGAPTQRSLQRHPSCLLHDDSDDSELHDVAEPRHSRESEPDQLHPSWLLHAAELEYDSHERADPLQPPEVEQPLPHDETRAPHAVGVPTQLPGGAHSARLPIMMQTSGLAHAVLRARPQASVIVNAVRSAAHA